MRGLPATVAIVALLAGCGADAVAPAPADGPVTSTTTPGVRSEALEITAEPPVSPLEAAPSTSTTLPAPEGPRCDGIPVGNDADAPPELAARIYAALLDPAWQEVDVSASVWIDGIGEVVSIGADQRLLPASNQKLFTAIGSHLLLPEDLRFTTQVLADGGSLVLRAGGDPTLRSTGTHSLAALARQVRAAGVEQVDELVVDVRHFESAPIATGWQDWHVPTYVGPMSALIVDDNRGRSDEVFLADPALAHLGTFAEALRAEGVQVGSTMRHVEESASLTHLEPLATVTSATVAELRATMLLRSDNEVAESILRQIGDGSTADGVDRVDSALADLCTGLTGTSGDGSGLSRANLRSAREWRMLLQVARDQPWGSALRADLPVAAQSGTLSRRLGGPATAGSVRAKTGSIIGGRSLSGYATTADGRDVVFAIVVNGDPAAAAAAVPAIDALVTAVVAG